MAKILAHFEFQRLAYLRIMFSPTDLWFGISWLRFPKNFIIGIPCLFFQIQLPVTFRDNNKNCNSSGC